MIIYLLEQVIFFDYNFNDLFFQECNMEKIYIVELLLKEKFIFRLFILKCVIDITNDINLEKVVQENLSIFGIQTFQKMDFSVSDLKYLIVNIKYLEIVKRDFDQSWVSDVVKVDLI